MPECFTTTRAASAAPTPSWTCTGWRPAPIRRGCADRAGALPMGRTPGVRPDRRELHAGRARGLRRGRHQLLPRSGPGRGRSVVDIPVVSSLETALLVSPAIGRAVGLVAGIGLLGWPVSESGRLCKGAWGLGATDGATAPPDGANVVYARMLHAGPRWRGNAAITRRRGGSHTWPRAETGRSFPLAPDSQAWPALGRLRWPRN